MFAHIISFALMATAALASQALSPVHNFGVMLTRDTLTKRQGYYPTTSYCGSGDTCQEACGPTYEQCASLSDLYCFVPSIGEQCCPDLTGNSCNEGYYCTTDGAGTTYCCPNELDLSNCAAAYSLTVSLIRETATPTSSSLIHVSSTPTSSSLIHVSSTPTSSSLIHVSSTPTSSSLIHVSSTPTSSSLTPISSTPSSSSFGAVSSAPLYPTASYSKPVVTIGNATYTSATPPVFTGAASKVGRAGIAVLLGAAGALGVL